MVRALAAVVALLGLGLSAECERRTPPEEFTVSPPAPSPATAAAASGGPSVASAAEPPPAPPSGRCLLQTPATPPPPVPAGPAPGCPADPEPGLARLPTARVAFPDAGGGTVDAEIVRSQHDTQRGLMYRKHLDEERGMLFDLRFRDDHKFWMHNTCIPLDLLYVDEDGLIVGIVENAPTLDDDSRGVGCPSRWVLEVNAGWTRRHGVRAGQHMSVPSAGIP